MNNKILFIVFAALLGLFLVTRLLNVEKKESFDPIIAAVDTDQVDRVIITPKASAGPDITLHKEGTNWLVSAGDIEVAADDEKVQGFLEGLVEIKAQRVVTKSPEKWAEYEVNEVGSRVQVFSGETSVADFVIGAFKFDQVKRSASTYMRKSEADPVYIVDGFVGMQLNRDFNSFRNNSIINLAESELSEIRLIDEDGEQAVIRDEYGLWHYAGMQAVDSTAMAEYIAGLQSVVGQEFVDTDLPDESSAFARLEFTTSGSASPTVVHCYRSNNSSARYILNSTTNAESFFASDSSGVYDRIFGKFNSIIEAL